VAKYGAKENEGNPAYQRAVTNQRNRTPNFIKKKKKKKGIKRTLNQGAAGQSNFTLRRGKDVDATSMWEVQGSSKGSLGWWNEGYA